MSIIEKLIFELREISQSATSKDILIRKLCQIEKLVIPRMHMSLKLIEVVENLSELMNDVGRKSKRILKTWDDEGKLLKALAVHQIHEGIEQNHYGSIINGTLKLLQMLSQGFNIHNDRDVLDILETVKLQGTRVKDLSSKCSILIQNRKEQSLKNLQNRFNSKSQPKFAQCLLMYAAYNEDEELESSPTGYSTWEHILSTQGLTQEESNTFLEEKEKFDRDEDERIRINSTSTRPYAKRPLHDSNFSYPPPPFKKPKIESFAPPTHQPTNYRTYHHRNKNFRRF